MIEHSFIQGRQYAAMFTKDGEPLDSYEDYVCDDSRDNKRKQQWMMTNGYECVQISGKQKVKFWTKNGEERERVVEFRFGCEIRRNAAKKLRPKINAKEHSRIITQKRKILDVLEKHHPMNETVLQNNLRRDANVCRIEVASTFLRKSFCKIFVNYLK